MVRRRLLPAFAELEELVHFELLELLCVFAAHDMVFPDVHEYLVALLVGRTRRRYVRRRSDRNRVERCADLGVGLRDADRVRPVDDINANDGQSQKSER